MKRFLCILLIAAAVIGLMTTTAMAEEYATVYSGNGYPVRLRSGPSKSYDPIASYNVGTTVIVLQRDASWSQLKIGDVQGWMMNEFLRFGTTGTIDPSTGQVSGETATVTSGNGLKVWLRTTANGKRIALYAPGTQVTVITKGDKWSYISIAGVRGYMMTKFLKFTPAPEPSSLAVQGVSINYTSPVVGDELTATVTPADATVTYSWLVNGVVQSTSNSLRVLDAYKGHKITVRVTGTGAYYGSKQTSTIDAVTDVLSVTGVSLNKPEPIVGDTLSAVLKPSSATVTYSWRVGGTQASTEATYTVQEADVGKLIQLKVVGTDRFDGIAICSAKENVRSDKALYSAELNIKDRPVLVGEVLSATLQPSAATVKYTWMADGEVVATTASYKVTQNDLGKKITLKVEGTSPYTGTVITEANGVVKQATLSAVKLSKTKLAKDDTVSAVLTPSTATATYQWYTIKDDGDPVEIKGATGSSLTIDEKWVDQKIVVRAFGSGIYTVANSDGYIQSAASDKVTSTVEITAVAVDITTPVVGDKLTAKLTPDELNSNANALGYIWMVGNETLPQGTNNQYTVKESDVGKAIRVQAIGDGTTATGKATSAWTSAVVATSKLTGLSIVIQGTDPQINAASTTPQVGQTLTAVLAPAGANQLEKPGSADPQLKYEWKRNGATVSTDATYTLGDGDNGYQIVLVVTAIENKSNFTGSVNATTAKVAKLTPVKVDFSITEPKAGAAPQTSVTAEQLLSDNKTKVKITGTIQWVDSTNIDKPAEMDDKGHFKPGVEYTAKLTLTSASSSLGWMNASITVNNEATQSTKTPNVFAYKFKATGSATVTNYFISGIDKPVPGGSVPAIEVDTEQYEGDGTWDNIESGKFLDADKYTATITLTAKSGYTFDNVPANAFTVSGADETTSKAGNGTTLEVTAKYTLTRDINVTAERDTVYVDGTQDVILQCFAKMTNMSTQPTDFVWSVEQAQSTITKIDAKTGKLTVGRDEKVDKALVVRAKWTDAAGKTYDGFKSITIASGTEASTERKVVFSTSPVSVATGETAQFDAYVTNSTADVTWSVQASESGNTTIDDTGKLTVGANETSASINVVATAKDDSSIKGSVNVKILKRYTVAYKWTDKDGKTGEKTYIHQDEGAKRPDSGIDESLYDWTPALEETVKNNVVYEGQPKKYTVVFTWTEKDGTIGNDSFTVAAGSDTPKPSIKEDPGNYSWTPTLEDYVTASVSYQGTYSPPSNNSIMSLMSSGFARTAVMSETTDDDVTITVYENTVTTEEATGNEDNSEQTTQPEDQTNGEQTAQPEDQTNGEQTTQPEDQTNGEQTTQPEDQTNGEQTTQPEDQTNGDSNANQLFGTTIRILDDEGNELSKEVVDKKKGTPKSENTTTDGNKDAVLQEPSDEEYDQKDEEEATQKNVSISWKQKSLKIARGYRADFKLNVKTDAKYTIKWQLWERTDGGKVTASSISRKGRVKVGENETATSFRVVAEITLADGTVLYRRVTVEIVDPKDAPEGNLKLTGTETDDEDEDEVKQDGKDQKEQPKPTDNNGNEGGQNNGGSSENESNGSTSGGDAEKKMAEEALKEENKDPTPEELF